MEQPQAFTCPYCGRMGYTEMSLQEHVAADHTETSTEVVRSCLSHTVVFGGVCPDSPVRSLLSTPPQICPICAALPGGDPNHVTDDFAAHLTLEHRAPRDLISFTHATSCLHE